MPEDISLVAFRTALGGYVQALIELLRIVTGLPGNGIARKLHVHPVMISKWRRAVEPLPPQHERALRELLMEACTVKRRAVAQMDPTAARTFQHALIATLVSLDGRYVALMGEWAKSRRRTEAQQTEWLEFMGGQAMTPEVAHGIEEASQTAPETPSPWAFLKVRNRRLRKLVERRATANVLQNCADLLTLVEEWYAIEDGWPLEHRSGIGRRLPGRPRKVTA